MKLIDVLLRLYPEAFRHRFGRDIRAFHEERVRESRTPWLRIVADHVVAAFAEQLHALAPDVRQAVRGMLRRPAFTLVILLTVALGVGVNVAIFSFVNGILLRPLPYPDADRLVALTHAPPQWLVSEPQFVEYRTGLEGLESLAAYSAGEANLDTPEDAERIAIASVTPELFATLGTRPVIGRTFARGEDQVRPSAVVVLSHGLWRRRFGEDRGIIGRTVMLNGVARTVIGVMPEHFAYPARETELWLPLCTQRTCASFTTLSADARDGWANHYLSVVGRLREGASLQQLRADARAIAERIMREQPDNFDPSKPLLPQLVPVHESLVGGTRPYLHALFGAVGFVLLIVCANIANLLLARGEGRRHEMAVRTALGAPRRRLIVQLLTESVVLAIVGGLAGIALAWAGHRTLLGLAPPSIPRLTEIRLDWTVVAFGVAVSAAAGLLFGLAPAVRTARQAPADSLKSPAKGIWHRGSNRARRALVTAEVALAMVLLSGAGMLVRSLVHLHQTDVGFEPSGALTARVSPNTVSYDDERLVQFYDQLLERLRSLPGVRAAGAARWTPVVDAGGHWEIRIEDRTYPPSQNPIAVPQDATPGYFAAMGMSVLRGRAFTDQDRLDAPPVGIVSNSFARTIWGDEDPLGRRFRLAGRDSMWVTVVGVVDDIHSYGFIDTPEPTMYFPHAQTARSSYYVPASMSLVVRSVGAPRGLEAQIRAAVRALDATVPVSSVRTLEEVVGSSIANRRFSTALVAAFAGLALVLAGIGIYGVVSYTVSERRFEIGVRMALGAGRERIVGLILRDAARMALLGIGLGVIGSAALAHGLRGLLVGIPIVDVATLAATGVLLTAAALLASLVPARRATFVNPTQALRGG